jgi:ABC-2 type transport system permease protein
VVDLLPFKYLAYFPAAVFLEKLTPAQMYQGLAIEFSWVVALVLLSRVAWSRGVAHYSGFGG